MFSDLDYLPNKERTDVTPTRNNVIKHTAIQNDSRKEIRNRRSVPRPLVAAKPASALSSAVSTISTITLTENDNKRSDETDDLDKV